MSDDGSGPQFSRTSSVRDTRLLMVAGGGPHLIIDRSREESTRGAGKLWLEENADHQGTQPLGVRIHRRAQSHLFVHALAVGGACCPQLLTAALQEGNTKFRLKRGTRYRTQLSVPVLCNAIEAHLHLRGPPLEATIKDGDAKSYDSCLLACLYLQIEIQKGYQDWLAERETAQQDFWDQDAVPGPPWN
ncbi:hypothetical protein BV25DRAFT_1836584 [Artomyces pyxidatus]|uniref:Uncharacterized protein n=1 Tax=Artomyces pyxidatus TaxID=48021 RepID=A0ACB8T9L5_9AGAM|nr:hypothetical protein BV25DRAFT_1836584 [Artomyces pyxidatus]